MAPTGHWDGSAGLQLSMLEDEQVVARARAGSPDATEYLLRKYRGFVESKARSYFLAGAEPEDVVQEGMIGLYKAIRDYRGDRLAQFRSFAELCVTRQIITAVKSASRNKHALLNECVSLQRSISGEDEDACLMDVMADVRGVDPEMILMERSLLRFLQGPAVEGLSSLEHEVLEGYVDGKSYAEMADELARPAKTIDNALQRAKKKVGTKLTEAELAPLAA